MMRNITPLRLLSLGSLISLKTGNAQPKGQVKKFFVSVIRIRLVGER